MRFVYALIAGEADFSQHGVYQHGDVARAIPQGRHVHSQTLKTPIQLRSEPVLADVSLETGRR